MTNQSTIDKLIEMRLTTMADAFRNQLDDPKFKEVPFEDRFGMLVDIEYSNRKNNRQKRQPHATSSQPNARLQQARERHATTACGTKRYHRRTAPIPCPLRHEC